MAPPPRPRPLVSKPEGRAARTGLLGCLVILLGLGGLYSPLAAAQASHRGNRGGMGMGQEGDRGPGERRSVSANQNPAVDQAAKRLADVHEQLKLRPDQEAVWEAYGDRVMALMADQLRPPAYLASGVTGGVADGGQKLNALAQMEQKVDVVRDRLTALEDLMEMARRLYGRLDGEQQRVADSLLPATLPELYSGLWQGGNNRGGPGGPGGSDGGQSRGEGRPPR